MTLFYILFWCSLAILFYAYFGYGLLVLLLNNIRLLFSRKPQPLQEVTVPVTIVIPAYNEVAVLKQKLVNTLSLDYPSGLLSILVVTDGSTDEPASVMAQFPQVQWLHQPVRLGKYAAIRRAMRQVKTPVVVFTDANTMLNPESVRMMVIHYQDPRTGGVAGEKKILSNNHASAVGEAEGMYWLYESLLKKLDGEFYTVVGAAGELFSIRTALFPEMNEDIILDDFIISMKICLAGYRIAYEPDAFATELPSSTLSEEKKRKVRIAAGAYQSIRYLRGCLNFFRRPVLAFQFFSRRLLRWVFCPFLIPLLLAANIVLYLQGAGWIYSAALWLQGAFFGFALIGWLQVRTGKRAGLFTAPFYFVFMNHCLVLGLLRHLRRRQSVLWERSVRQMAGHGF